MSNDADVASVKKLIEKIFGNDTVERTAILDDCRDIAAYIQKFISALDAEGVGEGETNSENIEM
ncbi:MAG: hypothetical protein ACRD5H_00895 [Nitrososphaerales archaeon]